MKPGLFFAALVAAAMPAMAQSHVDTQIDSLVSSTRMLVHDNGSITSQRPVDPDVRDRIITFYYDQYRNSQDPGAPYFMFMSKDEDLMMGIGGVVRMRGWYDWGGAIPGNAFMPYLIPVQPDPANRNKLGATPAGTSLFFRMMGRNSLLGDFQAYIEANFNGNGDSHDFHLKKAYVTFRDFTVGYASSTFSDPAAVSPTVDSQGPTNKLDHTTVLVRYMPRLYKNLLGAVSVELPETYIAADGVSTKSRSSYIPDFAAMLQYDWGTHASQHVRLGAVYRSLPYRDLLDNTNHNKAGWGVQLSSGNHPAEPLTLYLTANYGAGYAGMGGDLLAGNYDLVSDPAEPGRLYAPRSFGWSLGVQYNFRPNLFVSIMGSQTRYLPSKAIDPDEYKYGLMGAVNVFWNPLPRVQLGAELDLGKRQNFSGAHRYARRANIMAQRSF